MATQDNSESERKASNRRTRIIGPEQVEANMEMTEVIDAVENAFQDYGNGDATMPPKTYLNLEINGDFRAMPAAVGDAAGIKWVNVHPDNPEDHGLPTVMGVVILSDPETGYPLAIMDGTRLTRFRTGAAAGVATKHLASPEASTFGLLGSGAQAHTQLDAIAEVIDLERVVLSDLDEDAIERFIENESHRDVEFVPGSPRDVAACDVVSTTTPSRTPIIESEWIGEDTHINAIGADAKGKQELHTDVLRTSNLIVDDWEQCSHSGEINVPVSEGAIERKDVYSDLSDIVIGAKSAPRGERTVFDSTGLAIQDIATANLVYERAAENDIGDDLRVTDD